MDDLHSFTFVTDSEINSNYSRCIDPVLVHLLPGETFITFNLLNYGSRFGITNYRLIIIYDSINYEYLLDNFDESNRSTALNQRLSKIISIPIGLIYRIDGYYDYCLNIVTKIGARFNLNFQNKELCKESSHLIHKLRKQPPFSIDFHKALSIELPENFILEGVNSQDDWQYECELFQSEFERLKFPKDQWRISIVNETKKICQSYPTIHIVPSDLSDEHISKMAGFRSKNRFISVSYRSQDTGTVLLRSGQPMVGVSSNRNSFDENYINKVIELTCGNASKRPVPLYKNGVHAMNYAYNKDDFKFIIFDARSYTVAQANRLNGGGFEYDDHYHGCHLDHLNIPNMHNVRSCFDALSECLANHTKDNFYELLNRTGWLSLVHQLLESAFNISHILLYSRRSVLVHCTDGWDRTPQLVSLAQLLIDPYYRTRAGFITLIRKEWVYFGHKFNDRNGLWPKEVGRDFSPIFLQWLDCVFQLLHQFPDQFEFNELFLIKLALHTSSGLFSTFNQSVLAHTSSPSCSLWNLLYHRDQRCYTNPLYSPPSSSSSITSGFASRLIRPRLEMTDIRLWTALYKDGLNPHRGNPMDLSSSSATSSSVMAHFSTTITNCHHTYTRLTPNDSMFNSMVVEREEMELQNGREDMNPDSLYDDDEVSEGFKELYEANIDDNEDAAIEKTISNMLSNVEMEKTKIIRKRPHSYFNIVRITDSWKLIVDDSELNNVEKTSSYQPVDYDELGFDGLYHQKDLVNVYTNLYRKNRKLLLKKLDFFRWKCRLFFEKLCQFSQKAVEEIAIADDVNSSYNDNNDEDDSSFSDMVKIDSDFEVSDSRFITWVPDNAVSNCTECKFPFSMFFRKHHCRSCGLIFCNTCSTNRCPVPKQMISWPERVCDGCYANLNRVSDQPTSSDQPPDSSYYYSKTKFEAFKRLIGL